MGFALYDYITDLIVLNAYLLVKCGYHWLKMFILDQ